jgi:hypothetical protein
MTTGVCTKRGKQIQLEDPDGNPVEPFEPASSRRGSRLTATARLSIFGYADA